MATVNNGPSPIRSSDIASVESTPLVEQNGSLPAQSLPTGEDAKAHEAKIPAKFSFIKKIALLFPSFSKTGKTEGKSQVKNTIKTESQGISQKAFTTMQKIKAFFAPVFSKVDALKEKTDKLYEGVFNFKYIQATASFECPLYEIDAKWDDIVDLRAEVKSTMEGLKQLKAQVPVFAKDKHADIDAGIREIERNVLDEDTDIPTGKILQAEDYLMNLEREMRSDDTFLLRQLGTYTQKLGSIDLDTKTPKEVNRIIEKCDKHQTTLNQLLQKTKNHISYLEKKHGSLDQINSKLQSPRQTYFETFADKQSYEKNIGELEKAQKAIVRFSEQKGEIKNLQDEFTAIKARAEKKIS